MDTKCRLCWWQESRQCFNEEFAVIHNDERGFRQGESIAEGALPACKEQSGYYSKREALRTIIPESIPLIITSERRISN